jgi:hypothetical protein
LLVAEDFVLITASKKTLPATGEMSGRMAAAAEEAPIVAGSQGGFVKRGGGRGSVADHILTSVYPPGVF